MQFVVLHIFDFDIYRFFSQFSKMCVLRCLWREDEKIYMDVEAVKEKLLTTIITREVYSVAIVNNSTLVASK